MEDFCADKGLKDPEKVLTLFRSFRDPLQQLMVTGKAMEFVDFNFREPRVIIDDRVINIGNLTRVLEEAKKSLFDSYAPYSHFNVGAAILVRDKIKDKIYRGANIENAAYGSTICAERTAAFNTVLNHQRRFRLVGIVGDFDYTVDPKIREAASKEFVFPCGCCRQVLNEFGGKDLPIAMARDDGHVFVSLLKYLLPGAFGPEALGVDASEYSRHNRPKVIA